MPQGRTGLSGSEIGFILALSPVNVAGAGSTNPVDLSQYEFLNILVESASDDLTVNLERSATSNGTFAQVGLSMPGDASKLTARGFALGSSAFWYKVSYDIEGAGSAITSIQFVCHPARRTPVKQHTNTTVYSTIL